MLVFMMGYSGTREHNDQFDILEHNGIYVAEGSGMLDSHKDLLLRCDAVLAMPGWGEHKNNQELHLYAEMQKIPIYYEASEIQKPRSELTSPLQCKAFIEIVMAMYRLHLLKNSDYSPCNILVTGEIGLITRLWDKIARLLSLHGFRFKVEQGTYEKPEAPKNESIDDSLMDAAVYSIIGMLLRKGVWGK
jgi:hypothetical protein